MPIVPLMPLAMLAAVPQQPPLVLEGSWEMASAYEILADGSRATAYGEHPRGLMMIDAEGRYTIQIVRPDRPLFASGDKTRGTPEEYRQVVEGSSTHFGHVSIDAARRQLVFDIQAASFPNWEGRRQVRDYSFKDGLLSYAVPAGASSSGVIAWSIWRRVRP
jgi:hypothetical protein